MAVTTGTMLALTAAVSAVGQIQQGRAAQKAADAQAQQDDRAAAEVRDQGMQEADRIRKAAKKTQGAARAQLAASGVNVDSGTALLIDQEIGEESELDAKNVLLTGERRARSSEFAASQARARGRGAMTSSVLGAINTGLQGWKGVKAAPSVARRGHDTFGEGEY